MSFDKAKTIIADIASLGGKKLQLSGGEPLRHPQVYDLIGYAKDKGLKVELFTCGITHGTSTDAIARRLSDLHLDEVSVSLYGSYYKTHEDITASRGSFRKTVLFIRDMIKNGLRVNIHLVPMKTNFEEIREVIQFAAGLKASEVQVLRFVLQGRGIINREALNLSDDEFCTLVELVTKERGRTDIKVNPGTPFDFSFIFDEKYTPKDCTAGINKCLIKKNGQMLPCPAFGDLPDYVAGNVIKTSLSDVWNNSSVFNGLRSFDRSTLRGRCRRCKYLSLCRGRCPAERIRVHGNICQGPDPFCPLTVLPPEHPR